MDEWVRTLVGGGQFASFGGFGIATAAVLLLLLRVVLPPHERRRMRMPLFMLVANVVLVVLRAVVPMPATADRVLSVLALFVILASIGHSSFVLIVDWLLERRLSRPLPKIFRDILQVFLYFAVAFLTLPLLGLEPGELLTTSALLTAVIGLSMQETLGNLFAGLAIQAQRPFVVGDFIKFDIDESLTGRVTEINWRATKVMTDDLVEVIVPNGTLAKAPISNFTQPTVISRRTVSVQAPYEAAPHLVVRALLEAVGAHPDVLESPAPDVILVKYADSGIEYALRYYIRDYSRRRLIDSAIRTRVWYAFQRARISIPFPIRDVRARDMTAENKEIEVTTLAERRRRLTAIDFLAELPEPVIERLAARTRVALYSDGEDIIRQGEPGSELFIVRRGEVVVLVSKDGKRPVEVARLGPGKFFGEMSLMTGEARTATVVADGTCELFVVGQDEIRDILESQPDLALHFAEVLAGRRAELGERAGDADDEEEASAQTSVLLSRIKSFFSL